MNFLLLSILTIWFNCKQPLYIILNSNDTTKVEKIIEQDIYELRVKYQVENNYNQPIVGYFYDIDQNGNPINNFKIDTIHRKELFNKNKTIFNLDSIKTKKDLINFIIKSSKVTNMIYVIDESESKNDSIILRECGTLIWYY